MSSILRHARRCRTTSGVIVLMAVFVLPSLASAQTETVEYYGLDALGSVRVIFDAQGNLVDRMDYGPFGENLRAAIRFPVEQFAQLARDAESGQDYAQARNYSAGTGRFNRSDPVYGGLFDPQQWNRYVYARNSPLVFIDPVGLFVTREEPECLSAFDPRCADWNAEHGHTGVFDRDKADHQGTGSSPRTPTSPPPPVTTPDNGGGDTETDTGQSGEEPNLLLEFAKGCGEGAAGFVDGVIPFADPLQALGAYSSSSPAAWWSQPIGGAVRNFALAELSIGSVLGQAAQMLAELVKGVIG